MLLPRSLRRPESLHEPLHGQLLLLKGILIKAPSSDGVFFYVAVFTENKNPASPWMPGLLLWAEDVADGASPFAVEGKGGRKPGFAGEVHFMAGRFDIVIEDEVGVAVGVHIGEVVGAEVG